MKIHQFTMILSLWGFSAIAPTTSVDAMPRWVRGPSEASVGFVIGSNYRKTIVLLDAVDLYQGSDTQLECYDEYPSLGLSQQFCQYPDVKNIWVSPNKIEIQRNLNGLAAVSILPSKINDEWGLLARMRVRAKVSDNTWTYLEEQFPQAHIRPLRADSVRFNLVTASFPETVFTNLNEQSLRSAGDETYVEIQMTHQGIRDIRCAIRMRDIIVRYQLKAHDVLTEDILGLDFFTTIAGEYIPTYKALSMDDILFEEYTGRIDITPDNVLMDVLVSEKLNTDPDDIGVFLPFGPVNIAEQSPSTQAAILIEDAVTAYSTILSDTSLDCPLDQSDADSLYALRALELIASDDEALADYQASVSEIEIELGEGDHED